jgi:hypothetical protein
MQKKRSVLGAASRNHANKIDLNRASTHYDEEPEPPTPEEDEDEIIFISLDDED